MTFARDPSGNVIEFDGRRPKRHYAQKPSEPATISRETSLPVIVLGRILKPLATMIRRKLKTDQISAKMFFLEDGCYGFTLFVHTTDGKVKATVFCEESKGRFSVHRGTAS